MIAAAKVSRIFRMLQDFYSVSRVGASVTVIERISVQ
jgi:hypothetical protein